MQLKPEVSRSETLPQVVLIHGLAANLSFWYFSIAPKLAEIACVTLFDLRGHGHSSMPSSGYHPAVMAEDLAQLLNVLEINHPHLIGHSLGGTVMAHFCEQYPQRPASLTFADVRLKLFQAVMGLQNWPQWDEYRPLLQNLGIELKASSRELGYQLLAEMARLQVHAPELSTQLQAILPSSLFAGFAFTGKGGQRAAQQLLTLLEATTVLDDLSQPDALTESSLQRINCPILAVYGALSQTLPTLKGLQHTWPQLQTVIVPESGHFFPASQPDALLKPLIPFLTGSNL